MTACILIFSVVVGTVAGQQTGGAFPNHAAGASSIPSGAAASDSASTNVIVNMVSFGADPSGIHDSAPAVRSMLASLGNSPATLYFPRGTYRFASPGPNGREECVRINHSISLLGDGPNLTIFADDPTPACMALVGYFYTNPGPVDVNTDYSFETDPGYPVIASSAQFKSSSLNLTNHPEASLFASGQYVYLRGSQLPQVHEYHGELNRIAFGGDGSSGAVKLLWPLSSDFTQDSNLQLNMIASSEVVTNIQVSGITFNFHDNALLAAQVLGFQIFNNTFNYLGSSPGNEVSQFNQDRNVEFHDNVVTNPIGPAIDVERTSNGWDIYNNTLFGFFDAGEGGSNINFHDNTITCVNLPVCIRFGGSTGNIVNHNQISASCPSDSCHVVTDVSGPVTSPGTVISNNVIHSTGPRAIAAYSKGTMISGNTIFTDATGIDIAGGVSAFNNTVTLTASRGYGCVLVEGDTHNALVSGLKCTGYNAAVDRGIWIANNGPQVNTPLVIDGVTGSNLNIGIYIANPLNDIPILSGASFANTTTALAGTSRKTW